MFAINRKDKVSTDPEQPPPSYGISPEQNRLSSFGTGSSSPLTSIDLNQLDTTDKDLQESNEQVTSLDGSMIPKKNMNEEQFDLDKVESNLSLVQRLAKRIPCFGILLSLCSSLFLGTAGMLVKLTTSVNGIQVAVFR